MNYYLFIMYMLIWLNPYLFNIILILCRQYLLTITLVIFGSTQKYDFDPWVGQN